jgi:transposase
MSDGEASRLLRERDAEIEQLKRHLQESLLENARLRVEIAELRERLNQNSQNSSRPPSSDPPSAPARAPKSKSGRKAGGQPGHRGHQRNLVPVDQLAAKPKAVKPARCRKCGLGLTGEDPNPSRHQVVEWPEVKPEVLEWQLHELLCMGCGARTRAELPPGVPRGGFGPRLIAVIALLSGAYRLSKRMIVDLLANIGGIPISVGSVPACEQLASEAIAKPVDEARTYVKEQPLKHADESSWFEGPKRAKVWLWTASTALVTVFLIRASRGKDVALKLLGKVCGVLVTDRWCAYAWWPIELRQLCWSHIKRHFKAMQEAGGQAGEIGERLLELERRLFGLWHRVRDGTLQRSSFRTYASEIRCEVRVVLDLGRRCPHKKTATTCTELLKLERAMWTFVRIEGVEPTNNHGEHAIRPGVMWRKLCFGTHSRWGSRFVERMLTVVYTLKQQKRNALAFVTQCVEAKMRGQAPGSLLPAAG